MRQALLPQILKPEDAVNELAQVLDPLPDSLKLGCLDKIFEWPVENICQCSLG